MEKTEITPYQQFIQEVDGKKKVEEKIRLCLEFMRQTLSQEKTPSFRDFWQAKRLCLDLFKEKISPRSRTVFWTEYIELSDENRRLKEVLDEQSSFAKEQIDLAIVSLEEELEKKELLIGEMDPIEVPKLLGSRAETYNRLQKELNLLSSFAGRLTALRKELIHVPLRIKQKNELFQRLSSAGDLIFPRRKELMGEIATSFAEDVTQFVESEGSGPLFQRKEEIKALQNFAKVLTLTSASFTQMRNKLSECWDQVKEQEKEKNQERAEKRGVFKENFDKMQLKIQELVKEGDTLEKIEALLKEMRDLELGRDEVKLLKKELAELKQPLEEKEQKEREEREKAAAEKREKQMKARSQLLDHLQEVLNQADLLNLDALVEKWEALVKEEKTLGAEGVEKAMLQSRLESLFDHIQEKKWRALLEEENAEEISSSLHSLLDDRHKAKRKVKASLELYRKTLGGSALSMEESMLTQELASSERQRFDAIETMIEEIEEKLFDLEE
ncbi:MAG: hypothetical protein P0S96_05965 [Simkaniaceae bacterium]|nr:hypothetical protein [Candidatus Sacchlamyda saccharinae]